MFFFCKFLRNFPDQLFWRTSPCTTYSDLPHYEETAPDLPRHEEKKSQSRCFARFCTWNENWIRNLCSISGLTNKFLYLFFFSCNHHLPPQNKLAVTSSLLSSFNKIWFSYFTIHIYLQFLKILEFIEAVV